MVQFIRILAEREGNLLYLRGSLLGLEVEASGLGRVVDEKNVAGKVGGESLRKFFQEKPQGGEERKVLFVEGVEGKGFGEGLFREGPDPLGQEEGIKTISKEEAGVVAVFPGVLQQRESPFVQIADHDFHYTGKRSRVQRSGV